MTRKPTLKWNIRQRLQFVESLAYYNGVVSRSDIARTFGISDAAATKDLNFYGQLAPGNLIYRHHLFGFAPSDTFQALFADLSPAMVLPLIASNYAAPNGPYGNTSIYHVTAEALPLPNRLPDPRIVSQITRAMAQKRKLQVVYRSLSGRNSRQPRVLEPHALVNTGSRWHVRAYSTDTFDFRDFVLSRFLQAELQDEAAESSPGYDDDWVEQITLELAPHPQLGEARKESLRLDYGIDQNTINFTTRRAYLGYLLHALPVDTTPDHHLDPDRYPLIILNREDIAPFAAWAFT